MPSKQFVIGKHNSHTFHMNPQTHPNIASHFKEIVDTAIASNIHRVAMVKYYKTNCLDQNDSRISYAFLIPNHRSWSYTMREDTIFNMCAPCTCLKTTTILTENYHKNAITVNLINCIYLFFSFVFDSVSLASNNNGTCK